MPLLRVKTRPHCYYHLVVILRVLPLPFVNVLFDFYCYHAATRRTGGTRLMKLAGRKNALNSLPATIHTAVRTFNTLPRISLNTRTDY